VHYGGATTTPTPVSIGDDGRMELRPEIPVDDAVLDEFAHRHAIRRIAAFGSVVRGVAVDARESGR